MAKTLANETTKLRRETSNRMSSAYSRLDKIVSGDYSPGYFNRDIVVEEERSRGLSVCDAMLGRIKAARKIESERTLMSELFGRIESSIVSLEVENNCHNLHGAIAGMMDALGFPVVVVHGTASADAPGTRGFCLPGFIAPQFDGHRPGHSWLTTPYSAVVDFAIAHQVNVGDDYGKVKRMIPNTVIVEKIEHEEPSPMWYRLPGEPDFVIPKQFYPVLTRYHDVLGWSQFEAGSLIIRYLPASLGIPEETDLNDINVRINGLRPGDYFETACADLLVRSRSMREIERK